MPTDKEFDELLAFLPLLYGNGFKAIRSWGGGNTSADGDYEMPWQEYDPAVKKFFELAGKECWADCEYATKDVGSTIVQQAKVATASLHEIKTLLTWCVRGERFSEGHWGSVIEDGLLRRVLLRLKELRPQ